MKPYRPTESECQRTLIAAAKRGGWLVHHQRPALNVSGRWSSAIQGDSGFPDLVLCHRTRGLVFVELKRKPAKLSDAQVTWGMHLEAAGANWQTWWVPEETEQRAKWLVNG